jgi:Circularly permutated YpsA SLOG family
MLGKIVSGGQTGVDRAALDVALELGFPCGGWCPRGRLAEDGPLPDRYPLVETPRPAYPQRTGWNVRDADATLVLLRGEPDRGTRLTLQLARRMGKPCLLLDLAQNPDVLRVAEWIEANQIRILNVAGPRASRVPGVYEDAKRFLHRLLAQQRN